MWFVPFTVRYDMKFEGWLTEGLTAAPSHPSEGWHEKGHTSGQIRGHAERRGTSRAMFKSRPVHGLGVVFPQKKRNEPSGLVERTRELPEPTARNFLSRSLTYLCQIPAKGN
jgi:hypothetical protein